MAGDLYIVLTTLLFLPVVPGSRKKGVSVSPRAYLCDDLAVLDNIAWWYNWGGNFQLIERESGCDLSPHGHHFVAMIWGYNPNWFDNFYIEESSDLVLAYNEPNHVHQSNLTPEEAVAGWPTVEYFADGRPIVSPAAAHCGGDCITNSAEDWFDEFFFLLCQNESTIPCRVSYLATHIYSYNCNERRTMRELKSLYDRYGLKIWLTEFACPYTTDPAEQLAYMARLLPLLEEADYVYRCDFTHTLGTSIEPPPQATLFLNQQIYLRRTLPFLLNSEITITPLPGTTLFHKVYAQDARPENK